jgi:hypothetical protein
VYALTRVESSDIEGELDWTSVLDSLEAKEKEENEAKVPAVVNGHGKRPAQLQTPLGMKRARYNVHLS